MKDHKDKRLKDLFLKAKRVVVIEQHYDDGWLNVGGQILQSTNTTFKIISVGYDAKNNLNETERLKELLKNVECVALKFRSMSVHERNMGTDVAMKRFCALNDLETAESVMAMIEKEVCGSDVVMLPVGLYHPFHDVVLPQRVKSYKELISTLLNK